MYDSFIAHTSDDKERIVDELENKLSDMGFKVWYDKKNIEILLLLHFYPIIISRALIVAILITL